MAREILAVRPNGSVSQAKRLWNEIQGRRAWPISDAFTAQFETELMNLQAFFDLDPADGKLDRKTMNFLEFLLDPTPLPVLVHENGAIIPEYEGKVSLEVHLRTVGSGTEIGRHRALVQLPSNMTPANLHTAFGSTPWHGGSFGNLTPAEEQWYCNMRWPWRNLTEKAWYRGRRVKVTNVANGRACICTPGDYGPAEWTGHIGGVSPDVMFTLQGVHGVTCTWEWVEDDTPMGLLAA